MVNKNIEKQDKAYILLVVIPADELLARLTQSSVDAVKRRYVVSALS